MQPQQQLSPNPTLDDIPEFLENHRHRASSRDRRVVNGSSFDHRPPPASRHSRSRPVVMVAPHRNPVSTPRRRASAATTASSSTDQSSVFDYSQYPESDFSVETVPSLGPDPYGEGFGFLPCEFIGYANCDFQYNLADTEQWMNHIIEGHLGWRLPAKCACWYCDDIIFDSKENGLDVITNFRERLYHIREHIDTENVGVTNIRPDFNFVAHLWSLGMISQSTYNAVLRHREGPQSDVTDIYPYDFVPPEHQQQQDRSDILVVSESSRGERTHRRRDKKGRHHQH